MKIETIDNAYTVISCSLIEEDRDIYLCRDMNYERPYTIVRLKGKNKINHALEIISMEKNNAYFTDLRDFFISQGDLFVVFSCIRGVPLKKYLNGQLSNEERILIGENILKKLVMFKLSPYFICQCLKPENILITDSLDVFFKYTLDNIEEYESFDRSGAAKSCCSILQIIFEEELKEGGCRPQKKLMDDIMEGKTDNEMDILKEYKRACRGNEEVEENKKKKKKKSPVRICIKCFFFLLFLAVLIFMIFCINSARQPKDYYKSFDSIGTVNIKN